MRYKQVIAIIFIISLIVLLAIPIGNSTITNTFVVGFRLDYIIHCLIYLPWILVGKVIFNNNFKPLLWLVVGVVLSVSLELIQFILPYRSFNINDMIAGVIGVILSYFIFRLTKSIKCQNSK